MSDNIARLLALTAIGASEGGGGGALTPVVVNELPSVGEEGVLYLVSRQVTQTKNVFDEYIYVNGDWEKIGTTDIDFTNYYTKTETDTNFLSKNNTNSYTPVGNYNPATKKYVDDMLNVPTLTISLSQVISQNPLQAQLTQEQQAILENRNIPTIFMDATEVSPLFKGVMYRNGDIEVEEEQQLSFVVNYPMWDNESQEIQLYAIILLTLETTTGVLTVSMLSLAKEDAVRDVYTSVINKLAPSYDTTRTYKVGDIVSYNNGLWKCKTDINIPESWESQHWTWIYNYSDLLSIPTIAVTLSQIVSVAPLKILLTGEQVNILNDKNNIGVFLDGSAIDSLLVGHAYRNGDVTNNGKSFVSYTLDYPHWNNDSEFVDYNIGLLILDKATNILTVSIEPVMTETSFRAAFFDGTEEEWDALTQSQKESILFAAVSQEFELTQEEEETLLSVLGDDKAGIDVDTTLEETLDAFLNIAGENE